MCPLATTYETTQRDHVVSKAETLQKARYITGCVACLGAFALLLIVSRVGTVMLSVPFSSGNTSPDGATLYLVHRDLHALGQVQADPPDTAWTGALHTRAIPNEAGAMSLCPGKVDFFFPGSFKQGGDYVQASCHWLTRCKDCFSADTLPCYTYNIMYHQVNLGEMVLRF